MAKSKKIDVKEVLRDLLAIARAHLRRKPICEIMEWDRGDVKWDMGSKKKWGTIPNDKVRIVKPLEAYERAEKLLDQLEKPEKPKKPKCAHWGFVHYHTACCSDCGGQICTHFDTTDQAREGWKDLYPHCPYCGAKMEYVEPDIWYARKGKGKRK